MDMTPRRQGLAGPVIDRKLRHNLLRYVFQCVLASLVILAVLLLLDAVHQTAIIATLGASSFIVFASPRAASAQPRRLLGGYIVGTLAGIACSAAAGAAGVETLSGWHSAIALFGALSVGLSILVMTITDTEHPPAAGAALAYVLNEWTPLTLAVVMGAVLVLAVSKTLLRRILLDLV
ncbi:HPP family protein [Candidatus Fermentibacterales bacterium]|nr:HPP family protein [Candidatus Fermentibacterales bacterium]